MSITTTKWVIGGGHMSRIVGRSALTTEFGLWVKEMPPLLELFAHETRLVSAQHNLSAVYCVRCGWLAFKYARWSSWSMRPGALDVCQLPAVFQVSRPTDLRPIIKRSHMDGWVPPMELPK